ncbi:MAG: dTDP-6-deoxy-L-hexose 3-O-methyltransferase [Desulfobacterium sp.]|nr:dTDP-6-deoxy-L-hexose 3-O-methyltransferase [Desulfobacterium sp.]
MVKNDNQQEAEGFLRTLQEREAADIYVQQFESSPDSTLNKLVHFTRYVRRQDMTRLLARYEIFKRILDIKGSIIECGVYRGAGLMCWANFSAVLEPNNIMRRVYGFDTFDGFQFVSEKDQNSLRTGKVGDLASSSYEELQMLIKAFDMNRFLGHIPKIELIRGDACKTIPSFIESHQHVVVSLLFLDFDLYDPTKVALETFLPRMPKGAILVFDELDNPAWPGETLAALEVVGLGNLKIERFVFDPYIGFAIL